MKKQDVNNKLAFNKASVAELSSSQLINVNGGSSGFICDAVADVINDAINQMTRPMLSN